MLFSVYVLFVGGKGILIMERSTTCPHCNHSFMVTEDFNMSSTKTEYQFKLNKKYEKELKQFSQYVGESSLYLCPNCDRVSCDFALTEIKRELDYEKSPSRYCKRRYYKYESPMLHRETVYPKMGFGISLKGIPDAIAADYEEAIEVAERSPMYASAFFRACLQGMIVDLFNAKGRTFNMQLNSVRDEIGEAIFSAIDLVRGDRNWEISGREPLPSSKEEVVKFKALIELLFDEWYKRPARLANLNKLLNSADSFESVTIRPPIKKRGSYRMLHD